MKIYFKALLLLLLSVFLFSGCTTMAGTPDKVVTTSPANFGDSEYSEYLNTWPEGSTPVFLGTARRLSDREEESQSALVTAAIRASIYNQVRGLSKSYTEQSSSGSGRMGDFDVDFNQGTVQSALENMEVIKELQDSRGTYVLARYKDGASVNLPPRGTLNLNSSKWINNPPRISGYRVSVGFVRQSSHPADSITNADLQALEEMVKSMSLEIKQQQNAISTQGGSAQVKTTLEIAEATVKGFYVIARYVSPDGKEYYSLGICPENLN